MQSGKKTEKIIAASRFSCEQNFLVDSNEREKQEKKTLNFLFLILRKNHQTLDTNAKKAE